MILARVFDKEKNWELILHTIEVNPRIRMITPYMYHRYMDALIQSDVKRQMDMHGHHLQDHIRIRMDILLTRTVA